MSIGGLQGADNDAKRLMNYDHSKFDNEQGNLGVQNRQCYIKNEDENTGK